MKKVFLVIPNLEIGGAERLVLELAHGLNRDKYQVTIVCLYDKLSKEYNSPKQDDLEIVRLHKKAGLDFGLIFRIIKLFIKQKPDIVHTHLYVAPYVILPALLSRCSQKYHTIHNEASVELNRWERRIMWLMYKYFGLMPIAISEYIKKDVEKCYGLSDKKVLLVRNGIDTSKFKPNPKIHHGVKLISIGRLTKVKNHILLLRSFSIAVHDVPSLSLHIAGEGPERAALEDYITSHKLADKVKLLGIQDDISNVLTNSDIFISTSIFEGLPLTILEAMASAMPVIATPAGGIVDIVTKENGILTSFNPVDIASAIINIASDKNLAEKLGKNSLDISKKYDIKLMISEYEKLYDKHIK